MTKQKEKVARAKRVALEDPDTDAPIEIDIDELKGPVIDKVAPPSTRGPDSLPFHERSWQDFERITLVIAEHVDGMRGVRAYGVPGQRDHGIDLYGADPEAANVGYQAKRREFFDDKDLRAAVEKFSSGPRPVQASKLIICVSCGTDRSEMSETLEELRQAHDFDIDLYDRHRLSEKLKTRPDLVRRLFGTEWADAFCDDVDWRVPERTPADVLAEALVRGPVIALGLEHRLNRCDELANFDPASAAAELALIVETLNEKGFAGFAERLRFQQAELLISAGDFLAGADLLTKLAWEQIESGVAHWDRQALGRLRALVKEQNLPGTATFVAVVEAIASWYGQPSGDLDWLIGLSPKLFEEAHELADTVHLWLLETAIAVGDAAGAVRLATGIDEMVERRARLGQADPQTVRLRIAKADVDDDWENLVRDARAGRLGTKMAVLVHARRGRQFARHDAPEDADAEYSQSIQRACTAGLTTEAAAGLRSIISLRTRFGTPNEDINVLSQLANTTEASGSVGLFPGRDPQDAGAAALSRGEMPGALRWFRTALRRAVIRGDLNGEDAAHVAIADVLIRAGENFAGLAHAIAAGSVKDAKRCMPLSHYVDLRPLINEGPHWERATALATASFHADLIPDDEAAAYVESALAGTREQQRSFFAPHVNLNAWKALAALSERMTEAQAVAVLEELEKSIERKPGTYRFEDDEHVEIVIGIARTHQSLEKPATSHLARIIEQGDVFGRTAGAAIVRDLNPAPSYLAACLARLADEGNDVALETLGDLGISHPSLIASVQTAVEETLNAPEPPPGTFRFGTGLPRVAARARILEESERRRVGDHCMKVALNTALPESNRTEGLRGLLFLARHLEDGAKRDYFPQVIHLVRSYAAPAEVDRPFLAGLHPLSTMRIDLDIGSLPREALETAAALALSQEDSDQVIGLAMELLMRMEKDAYSAARAISFLDPSHIHLDLRILLQHPMVWVRQVAAVIAVHREPPPAEVAWRLAEDPDPGVRRSLASGLGILSGHDPELSGQIIQVLENDSHWSVRKLTSERSQTDGV